MHHKYLLITTADITTRNVADRALHSCRKRSVKGFSTYDEAHAAWDNFMSKGYVPDGCSHPDPIDNKSVPFIFPRPSQSSVSPFRSAPSTPSQQRPPPDSASSPFNAHYMASPSQGFPRPQPVQQPPATPTATRQRSTGLPMSTNSPIFEDDENNWWVVTTGAEPGVYYGRSVIDTTFISTSYISFQSCRRASNGCPR